MICQAMEGKRLCTYDGIRTIKGKKVLCIVHIDQFFKGEQIKWAPKRLISYELSRRVNEQLELKRIAAINEAYYAQS